MTRYALIINLSIALSIFVLIWRAWKRGESVYTWIDLILVASVLGLIGARLSFVLGNWGYYSQHLQEIIMIWKGGLSWQGAFLFAAVGVVIVSLTNKSPTIFVLDEFALVVPMISVAALIACRQEGCVYTASGFGMSWMQSDLPDITGTFDLRADVTVLAVILLTVAYTLMIAYRERFSQGMATGMVTFALGLSFVIMDSVRADIYDLLLPRGWLLAFDVLVLACGMAFVVMSMLRSSPYTVSEIGLITRGTEEE